MLFYYGDWALTRWRRINLGYGNKLVYNEEGFMEVVND